MHFRWDEKAGPQWKSDTLSSKRTRLGARKDRLMKKNNTVKKSLKKGAKKSTKGAQESITIGMDLGDKASHYCGARTGESTRRAHTQM